jgi:hypothetical protein
VVEQRVRKVPVLSRPTNHFDEVETVPKIPRVYVGVRFRRPEDDEDVPTVPTPDETSPEHTHGAGFPEGRNGRNTAAVTDPFAEMGR